MHHINKYGQLTYMPNENLAIPKRNSLKNPNDGNKNIKRY